MRYLPVFLDLQTGPVLLVGAGDLARAKLRLLVAAGAYARWFATDGQHDLRGFEAADAARIELADGDPLAADLSAVVAILCAGAGDVGIAMAARAKAVGLPVNVMDDPSLAGFIGRWRKQVHGRMPEMSLRRRFWERVVDGPIGALVLAGRGIEADQALKDVVGSEAFTGAPVAGEVEGSVTLVGAGPGDPDLLTIKALRALQDADVIFYDELVSPEILDRARRDASRVAVGRRAGKPGIGQYAINRLLIEAAKSGQRAVRLKGGDPFVFGRGGEEVEALRQAGVAYSVVPGISAGLGAAAQFEVPLTFRHEALRITFLTAHKAKDTESVDWSTLTDGKMTVVVYMGMTAAPAVRAGLLAAGRSPQTPVGVFARVTRPDAQAAVGTLDELPALIQKIDGGPAVLIVGDVVARSAPWRSSNLAQLAAYFQVAAA
jgi:uroporphyrin-III C-methyltransferase/precorrin-2 dehydrogenase/sirohydrochlorin ferrochelatase